MPTLFEIKDVDRQFYQQKLLDFLPDKIIDIHTHVWLDSMVLKSSIESIKIAMWPFKVALDNSIEDLQKTYKLLFPRNSVIPMIFTSILDKNNLDKLNTYVSKCAFKNNIPSLAVTRPDWSGDKFEEAILSGGFLGAKPYLIFSDEKIPEDKITIFDFLPHHQLEILDRYSRIVMLHIPRNQRLKDPVNLVQMLEIEQRYPNIKLIIAHVGRAYCPEDIGNAFEVLGQTKNMMFDFSANTNAEVFERLIKAVGPKRIMFGTDMPITRMRMRRICEGGNYINIVPKGLYGDISGYKNMREVEGKEAEELSLFVYEEIDAFRVAAEKTDMSCNDIQDVFYNNAQLLIESVKPKKIQLQMGAAKNSLGPKQA